MRDPSLYFRNKKVRQFFALCNELKIDSEKAKERAKKFFSESESFNNLSIDQIEILINKLRRKKLKRKEKNENLNLKFNKTNSKKRQRLGRKLKQSLRPKKLNKKK